MENSLDRTVHRTVHRTVTLIGVNSSAVLHEICKFNDIMIMILWYFIFFLYIHSYKYTYIIYIYRLYIWSCAWGLQPFWFQFCQWVDVAFTLTLQEKLSFVSWHFFVVCCSLGMNIFIVVFHDIFIGDEVLKSCGIILRFLHGVNQTFPFVISTKDGRLTSVAAVTGHCFQRAGAQSGSSQLCPCVCLNH